MKEGGLVAEMCFHGNQGCHRSEPQVNTGEEEDQRLGFLQQQSELNRAQVKVISKLGREKGGKGERREGRKEGRKKGGKEERRDGRKEGRKNKELVLLSELHKMTLNPLWEVSFSLEMY